MNENMTFVVNTYFEKFVIFFGYIDFKMFCFLGYQAKIFYFYIANFSYKYLFQIFMNS